MMPISASQKFNIKKQQGGFTLLELLLVVFIISVLAGLAVVSIGDKRADILLQGADKFRLELEQARSAAMLKQQMLGLEVRDDSYQLLHWDYAKKQWQPVLQLNENSKNERGLATQLSPELEFLLGASDIHATAAAEPEHGDEPTVGEEKTKAPKASILIYPDGKLSRFNLIMSAKNTSLQQVISGHAYAKVKRSLVL